MTGPAGRYLFSPLRIGPVVVHTKPMMLRHLSKAAQTALPTPTVPPILPGTRSGQS